MAYSKLSAAILSIIILSVIVLTGPANAVKLSIDIEDKKVFRGTSLNINSSIEIETSEIVDIDYISFILSGPEDIECRFYTNGTAISGCDGITINLIQSDNPSQYGYGYGILYKPNEGYGYGYGFKPGFLKYNLNIETDFYEKGSYKTKIYAVSGEKEFYESGESITIQEGDKSLGEVCSIRASNGEGNIQGSEFSKNKITFYIPVNDKASLGEGHITGQKQRDRFMYRFYIKEVIANNSKYFKLRIFGKYRIGTSSYVSENSILIFDKQKNKVTIIGEKINIKDMEINFRKGC